jgi:hypothetical protein
MKKQQKQAYKQKPWRSQMKWISQLLMVALFVLLASLIYLELAGEATSVYQQLITLRQEKIILQDRIADQQSELAKHQSAQVMKPRMEAMGFKRYTYNDVVYVVVPGYQPQSNFKLAPSSAEQTMNQPIIRSAYTESLWDWFNETIPTIPLLAGVTQ